MLRARVGRGDAAQNQLPGFRQTQVTVDRIRSGLLAAALALVALPASAAAAPYVPPGNSAATQYTEAVPTAGGPKATNKGKQGKQTPSKVLGAGNVKKLDAKGPEGQAAAEVAAATAPATVQAASPDSGGTSQRQESGQAGGHGSTTAKPSGGSSGGNAANHGGASAENPSKARGPEGSSGLGEVVGQATGSSSGQLGLLLPLLIVAVVIWSVAYLLRQRRRQAA